MTVTVFPGATDVSHDISLTDGTNTYGFTFAGGPRVLQEIPLSPSAQPFEKIQRTWVGGRGVINTADDATGYYDGNNLWSTSEGYLMPSLQWRFANRDDAYRNLPAANSTLNWLTFTADTPFFLANSFTTTSTTAMDRIELIVRRVGNPTYDLTVTLCADNANEPGTVLQTVTLSKTDFPTTAVFKEFDFSGTQAMTTATKYWIRVYSYGTTADHWEILANDGSGLQSTNGSTWAATLYTMFYRVTAVNVARKHFFFSLQGALYAVTQPDSLSGGNLYMNGFRGIAASATSTTLTCSKACTRDYTGAYIRIVDGTGDSQVRQITSNTTGASVVFTVSPAWSFNPDATSVFVVYGTEFWDEIASTGLTFVYGKPIVANNIAYFPQGTNVAVRRMRVNGNSHDFADEATVRADLMYVNSDGSTGTQVWSALEATSVVSNANVAAWGTDLVNLTTTTIGSTEFRITNMYTYKGSFIVFKEDGLYKFDGTRVTRFGKNFSDLPDIYNGAGVSEDNTYLWWSWGHSVERMLGENVTDMLNWRSGYEGLPASRRGVVSKILSVIGWLFAVVDGGTSNYSSVLCWNGFGWSELFRAHKTGARINQIAWQQNQEGNPYLWVDYNGELLYIRFPSNTSVPFRDTTQDYNYEGVLITPTLDMGSLETYKIIKSVRVFQSLPLTQVLRYTVTGITTASFIYVDYQKNEDVDSDNWTVLGTADASPFEEILMNVGGISRLRFRLRFNSATTRTPPICNGFSVNGREMPLTKYQFVGTYVAGTELETKQGDTDVSSNTVYAWLQTAATQQTKLTLRTLNASSDSKIVTVSLPVKMVDWLDEADWGGRISFSCMET